MSAAGQDQLMLDEDGNPSVTSAGQQSLAQKPINPDTVTNTGTNSLDSGTLEEPLQEHLLVKPAEKQEAEAEPEDPENVDLIDEAFMAMGGFGKLQKISYFFNTLINAGAALFIYCFVFLEKEPVYECATSAGIMELCSKDNELAKEKYCDMKKHDPTSVSIDWDNPESLHNLIEQLDFYCAPGYAIGLIGAAFLVGVVIGSLTLTRLGDIYGRRPIYLLGLVMHLGFMAGILLSTNAIIDYLLVFILGLSLTARYYVGYCYNIEMQPKSHYVLVGTSMFLIESAMYLSICLYFMFVSTYWEYIQIPNIVFISIGFVFMLCMPESPRFLIAQKRFGDARDVFKWIGGVNGLSKEEIDQRLDEIVFEDELVEQAPDQQFEGILPRASHHKTGDIEGAKDNRGRATTAKGRKSSVHANKYGKSFHQGMRLSGADGVAPRQYKNSFYERMGLSSVADGNRYGTQHYNMVSSFSAPVAVTINHGNSKDEGSGLKGLWSDPLLRQNLIASCFTWLFASFNFYLITFYLKKFPGSIFINSICFACADMMAFTASGIFLQWVTITQGIVFANSVALVGAVSYLFNQSATNPIVIPACICVSRIGGSMCFNIGYVSVARLFPTQYVATVFGVVNFVAHNITIGAPIVAELQDPIPMVNFCIMSVCSIFAALFLKEINKAATAEERLASFTSTRRASQIAKIQMFADEGEGN